VQQSTEETVQSLDSMNERISVGIARIEDAADDLSTINDSIDAVADSLMQVSGATDEQAQSTQEVAALVDEAVEGMSSVVDAVENTQGQAQSHQQNIVELRQFVDAEI